jgi:hypothetical protein
MRSTTQCLQTGALYKRTIPILLVLVVLSLSAVLFTRSNIDKSNQKENDPPTNHYQHDYQLDIQSKHSKSVPDTIRSSDENSTDEATDYLASFELALTAAQKGSPRHQFLVADILSKCQDWDQAPNEDNWNQLKSTPYFDDQDIHEAKKRAAQCNGIYVNIAPATAKELHQAWMAEAAANGDIYAQLHTATVGPHRLPSDALLPLVKKSIIEARGNQKLLSMAIKGGAFYFSRKLKEEDRQAFLDNSIPPDKLIFESQAWELLSCTISTECDEDELKEVFQSRYGLDAVEQRELRAREVHQQILNDNIKRLL